MTDLPPGWTQIALGDIAESVKNGIFVSRPGIEPNGVPILRISSVRPGVLNLRDIRYSAKDVRELSDSDSLLLPGDLLFTRYNGNIDYVGACAMVPERIGDLTYPDKLIRVRVNSDFAEPSYVQYVFEAPQVRSRVRSVARTTAGQAGVSGASLKSVVLPLPPLAEQRRIVAALVDALDHRRRGSAALEVASSRSDLLWRSQLRHLRQEALASGGVVRRLGDVAETSLGKMLDAGKSLGVATPYLRNVNVRWRKVDLSEVSAVPLNDEERRKFALRPGDLLVCEGGEPGRCAIWRGPDGMTFQKALHRVRVRPGLLVEWLALMIEEAVRNKRTMHLQTGSTIKHISQEKIRQLEVVVPDIETQLKLVRQWDVFESSVSALNQVKGRVVRQGEALQNSLLAEAFAGRLVPQDPNDEPASELLARIRDERAATIPKQRTRSRRTPKELAAPATRVTGDDYQQETLPL
ncbi:restriction endonuclease subunit S [Micromonospora sp. WMMD708]|uniref:restriction endonuclease subunit S n=1 Tax=Micromonospora sp. WMMD708 TaxID=3403464 RepID=UPI003BF4AD7B